MLKLLAGFLLLFPCSSAIAEVFKSGNRVYITDLAEKTRLDILIQRISYRKEIGNACKAIVFKTTKSAELLEIDGKTIIISSLPVREFKPCSDKLPRTDSYRSGNKFVITGLKEKTAYLVKIISPDVKSVKTNTCGYGSFKLVESLTPFSTSYEINVYSVQGVKLSTAPEREKPTCRGKR